MTFDELLLQLAVRTVTPDRGIFELGRMSTMFQFWHLVVLHFEGVVEIFVLTTICLRLGDCQCCADAHVLGGRHSAVAFPFFHDSFVIEDNGRMACMYMRHRVFHVSCSCFKSSLRFILYTLFHSPRIL